MGYRRGAASACTLFVIASAVAFVFSVPHAEAHEEFIMVDFAFVPTKCSYAPGEEFTIEFTVTNVREVLSPETDYGVKVLNLSARFSWMPAGEIATYDVSAVSSWLEPGEYEAYLFTLEVPEDAVPDTYTYVLSIDYLASTLWDDLEYTWGGDTTYRDFVVALPSLPPGVDGEDALDSTEFVFSPGKLEYEPGDELVINISVVNTLDPGDDAFDDLAYMVKVTNISARFSWMAPGEYVWNNVSESSSWLAPDGIGMESYQLELKVPDDLEPQTYSYVLRVDYLLHTPTGNVSYVWGGGVMYRDFVVSTSSTARGAVDYAPYLAAALVVLALGALGAVLYHRSQKNLPAKVAAAATGAAAKDNGYPVIHAVPGEHFPVERGFIYLVKEKRPNIAFEMFNEAISKGASGMLVVREHPDRMIQMYKFDAKKILWLTRRVGKDHADPTELSLLSHKISRFVDESGRSVVLLEGLEYMITQNDFDTVLRFVDHLHDFVLAHDCAFIIVIDPRVLSTREIALLERSAKVVEPVPPPPEEEPPLPGEGATA